MEDIAIIGAGVAGLAAAWSLARDGRSPVVFEKSRGLSGRAASRSHGNVRFDHGANFFRLDRPMVEQVVRHDLPTDDLVEIHGDVWTIDADGRPAPGDALQNAEPKYSYRHGISQLGKLLVETADLNVRRQTPVEKLIQHKDGWELWNSSKGTLGHFKRVILTAPAPQCLKLLESSEMDQSLQKSLNEPLSASRYHRQFSFILGFEKALPRSLPFHALVATNPSHPVAWLGFEEDKPGHLPPGQGALVVQMSPAWTDQRIDSDREDLLEEVLSEVESLLGDDFRRPDWWNSQRWMMAHPAEGVDGKALKCGQVHGLYFAGDAIPGRGRVPLALETGLLVANDI